MGQLNLSKYTRALAPGSSVGIGLYRVGPSAASPRYLIRNNKARQALTAITSTTMTFVLPAPDRRMSSALSPAVRFGLRVSCRGRALQQEPFLANMLVFQRAIY